MIIIDGKDHIAGRIATYAAKQALLGNEIAIVNVEQVILSGKQEKLYDEYLQKRHRGIPAKGPFIHRNPEKMMKRIVRGMLPYKKPRGREAFERIKCYLGVPEEYKDKKMESIEGAHVSKLPNLKYTKILNISKRLGAKVE